MRKIIFTAEVEITDKQAEKLIKDGLRMVVPDVPIASVFDRNIKFTSAVLKDKE